MSFFKIWSGRIRVVKVHCAVFYAQLDLFLLFFDQHSRQRAIEVLKRNSKQCHYEQLRIIS